MARDNGSIDCVACGFGHYQDQLASTVCQECHAGRFAHDLRSQRCHECPRGKFQNESDSSNCWPVPAGYVENENATAIRPCPSGQFHTADSPVATACDPCPPGTRSSKFIASTSCVTCKEGTACPANSGPTGAITCKPGTYAQMQSGYCFNCPLNTYTSTYGASHCRGCPDGLHTMTTGAKDCISTAQFLNGTAVAQSEQQNSSGGNLSLVLVVLPSVVLVLIGICLYLRFGAGYDMSCGMLEACKPKPDVITYKIARNYKL